MYRLLHGDRFRFTSGDSKGMNKLAAFAIGIILVAGVISTAKAQTIYFEDGSTYDLAEGESVYVSGGRVFEFTRFQPTDMQLKALEPMVAPGEAAGPCLAFGYGECVEESTETNFQEVIEALTERFGD